MNSQRRADSYPGVMARKAAPQGGKRNGRASETEPRAAYADTELAITFTDRGYETNVLTSVAGRQLMSALRISESDFLVILHDGLNHLHLVNVCDPHATAHFPKASVLSTKRMDWHCSPCHPSFANSVSAKCRSFTHTKRKSNTRLLSELEV